MLPSGLQRAPSLDSASNVPLNHDESGLNAPELQNLTSHDIRIIDAVIERAGSSATTFFTVFKAYSEVLKEHGLDPQEVVYYGKLLKLGTLRGKSWGEKWALVKNQTERVRRPRFLEFWLIIPMCEESTAISDRRDLTNRIRNHALASNSQKPGA